MHGVLGHTLSWVRDGDGPSHVKDGVLVGDDSDFEVAEGLMGASFKHGTLFVQGGAASGTFRRSLLGAQSGSYISAQAGSFFILPGTEVMAPAGFSAAASGAPALLEASAR